MQLSPEQRQAVQLALTHKVSVLTGGPGTGKTTTLRALIQVLERRRHPVALASPTGRAAKRLSEATGRPAQTLHRLLGFSPMGGFEHNEQNRLPADMIVVDEVSMLDLILTNNLLKAVDPAAHLLFVGDVDQLPSVGAGNVLRDLVSSGVVPVIRLGTIFRQAAASHIITNAHRINAGQPPIFERDSNDFFLFAEEDPEAAAQRLVEVVRERIPRRFGLDPLSDVQVLAPMHRGAVGVANLNLLLQAALNPPSAARPERLLAGRTFRAGDRVMQIRNNYQKEAFNGDIGLLEAVDTENQTLHRRVRWPPDRLRVERSRRAGARLRRQHPQSPGLRVRGGGRAHAHPALRHAPAQPALHRHHPRPQAVRPGRHPQSHRHGRPQRPGRPPLERPCRPPARCRHGRIAYARVSLNSAWPQ